MFRQMMLYGVIGLMASGLDTAIFTLLCKGLSWNQYFANVISVHFGMVVSFTLNRKFNFKVEDRTLVRFLLFYVTALSGLLLSQFILWVGARFPVDVLLVKIVSVFIVAAYQFVVNRTLAFRK